MLEKSKQLEKQMQDIQNKLKKMPEGKLICSHTGPYCKWEWSDGHKKTYISKKERSLAEHLTQKVAPNQFVRSKSEAMIVKVLKQNKIPYQYEAKLVLGDIDVYPDFTIRHPETGQWFYWEHFGLLDKTDYVKSMHSKLQLYTTHGIIPGINLITTYENKENPLTFEMIELLVKYYLS